MPKFFVKFEDTAELVQMASATLGDPLRRVGSSPYLTRSGVLIAEMSEEEAASLEAQGARVFPDLEFEPCAGVVARPWEARAADLGLFEVLAQIRAPEAWERTRGGGTTIVILDSGVCGTLKEIPPWKRSSIDIPSTYAGYHFNDRDGHGSMCAAIAAGTTAAGGKFNGVAPEATILSARTTFLCTDIYTIYEEILAARAAGRIQGPLIINNSYACEGCTPSPILEEDHPYVELILRAIDEGVFVVFAAGNNHHDEACKHDPTLCQPNSIWAANSLDPVLSVGTVNRDETNQDSATPHAKSSRGPGQWAHAHPKPDCVAPTYGEVVWGCDYRVIPWWGSSGACAQAAGLAALILAMDPTLLPQQVATLIRQSCRSLPASPTCVGHGILDCAAAVAAL